MTKELLEALEALGGMWDQYCDSDWGHMCMSAGERAMNVLDQYGLLIHGEGYKAYFDWDKLAQMEKNISE